MDLSVVILAAGQGTRMRSRLPKVLHPLAGRPLLEHVVETGLELSPEKVIVVYGHGGEQVRDRLAHLPVQWVEQKEQQGTGHAVQQALPVIPAQDLVLVLYGDVPLISSDTCRRLLDIAAHDQLALLTVELEDPTGYGRIVRDEGGSVYCIVEEKDANEEQRRIREVNTGFMAMTRERLEGWLCGLDCNNAQGEFYLTDIVAKAVRDGVPVETVSVGDVIEVLGVNDRRQLAELERRYQRMQAERLMSEGVTLLDPARFDLRGTLEHGLDVTIDVGVVLEGTVRLGDGVRIGPHVVLKACTVGEGAVIEAHSHLEQAEIGPRCAVGPFARIRPGTVLAEGAKVGNFVEIKKAVVGEGSKINHLSYVGDATVGNRVNIGAGTITCNYDGANKHRTVIGDEAFIGSDTQLVAPVTVGEGATIGAGSTITRDAPAGRLTLSRSKQITVENWKRPQKKRE